MLSSVTSTLFGSVMDGLLSDDDLTTSPIPGFYFEVDFYDKDSSDFKEDLTNFEDATGGGIGSAIMGNLTSALPSTSMLDFLDPGDFQWHKAFIEVSGIENGIDQKKTFNEGGYNYPIDLPDKLKNAPIVLKRLVRPKVWEKDDKWREWYTKTLEAMAFWETKVETKVVQVNIMHPNLGSGGEELILATLNFYDSYPSKVSLNALNSTSEDLLVEEIEISYSNMTGGYPEL